MSFDALIKDLIEAIKENTAALTAAISEDAPAAPAKAEKPAKGKKPAPVEEPEDDEAEEEAEPEEESDDEAEDDAEEDKSDEVLAVAKKAIGRNKDGVTAVLAKLKVKKVSDIPAAKHDLAIKLFKAVK